MAIGIKDGPPKATEAARGRGRPPKLTPELQEKICRAIRAGNYVETAAALNGVHKDTLYDWCRKGAWYRQGLGRGGKGKRVREDGVYADFSDAVDEALAQSEARDVLSVGKAAAGVSVQGPEGEVFQRPPDWRAAAWRLERKHPDRWGRRESLRIGGDPDAAPIRIVKTYAFDASRFPAAREDEYEEGA